MELVQAKQNESKYIGVSNNDLRDSKDSFGSKDTFPSKSSSSFGMLLPSTCPNRLHAQSLDYSTLHAAVTQHSKPIQCEQI